jgi:DNA-binding MarR family transcriptional regulator
LLHVSESAAQFPALVDEILRTRGRLISANGGSTEQLPLSGTQSLVLVVVARSEQPPTVPQIARSLGHSRQAVQRVVDTLAAGGYLEFVANPDHKRARRLVATASGRAAQQAADVRSKSWARRITSSISPTDLATTIATLRAVRLRLESDNPQGRTSTARPDEGN